MNFCNRSEEVLDYLLGSMERERRVSFESHLSSCPVCSRELSLERRIEDGLKASLARPDDLESRIEVALRILARQARPRPYFGRILAGVAAAAVLVSACWLISYRFLEGFVPSGAMGELMRALSQLTSSAGANLGTLVTAGTLTAAAVTIAAILPGE
jgi:anti-sigma factor RsiW